MSNNGYKVWPFFLFDSGVVSPHHGVTF